VRKKGSSDLTNEAKAFLQGKELQDLINVPEETFICFVIAMDIARYHFHAVECWFPKYQAYIDMPIKVIQFLEHHKTQNGVFATRKMKGFHEADISFYLCMQSSVGKECGDLVKFLDHLEETYSPSEIQLMHTTGYPTTGGSVFPFKFMYKSLPLIAKKEKVAKGNGLTLPTSSAESMAISAYCASEEV
jgi:hypothetical protein